MQKKMEVEYISETLVRAGPFRWDLRPNKSWTLRRPCAFTGHFSLKTYGAEPGPGFAGGWKLVSGGPFDDAGVYASFEEAVVGVVPWLVKYHLGEADGLHKMARDLRKWVSPTTTEEQSHHYRISNLIEDLQQMQEKYGDRRVLIPAVDYPVPVIGVEKHGCKNDAYIAFGAIVLQGERT